MRYAIYFTPKYDHPLTRKAATWLGRDVHSGRRLDQPSHFVISPDRLHELTQSPRRYGFHATLKAPFHLAKGYHEEDLAIAMERWAAKETPFTLPPLVISRIGPFFALVTSRPCHELDGLADTLVREFEPFRAPLSNADIARRNPDKLSEKQRQYLKSLGYPYVLDEFRFHMTLTGPVPEDERYEIQDALDEWFAPVLSAPVPMSGISLCVEKEPGADFLVRKSIPFARQHAEAV